MIRKVRLSDAKEICSLYNYYVENSLFTFEEKPVSVIEMKRRIKKITKNFPWYVWEEGREILGYAYLHFFHERSAYRFTAEDSVYVRYGTQKRGIGALLLNKLLDDAARQKVHSVMAVLGLPNPASEALHKKCGFEKIADINEMGFKLGTWAGNGYWRKVISNGAY